MAFLYLLSGFALLGVTAGHGELGSQPELNIMSRIINGKEAYPGSWPWHVALLTLRGNPHCGGSLINHSWVITAAHCNFTRAFRVVAGLHDLRLPHNSQELRITQIFRHPMYNPVTLHSDIALLKVRPEVHYNSKVKPLRLPHVNDQFLPGSWCKIMGWGYIHANDTVHPNKLQEATVTIIDNDICKNYWRDINLDVKFCAGRKGVASYCGDSGGSVVSVKDGAWTMAGIISTGRKLNPTNTPFEATRVTTFIPWIEEILANN